MGLYDSAVSLHNAMDDFLGEFEDGLPRDGSKRLDKLRSAYGSLPKLERDRFRQYYRDQYDSWLSRARPKPPPDATQPEMFEPEPERVPIEDRLAHWEGRPQPSKMGD